MIIRTICVALQVGISGFDMTSYHGAMESWNKAISQMYDECRKAGPDVCMMVYYEQLVLHPEAEMTKILQFLNMDWDEKVLHHETTIGKEDGVSLSK